MSVPITVHPDVLDALAGELTGLVAELVGAAEECAAAAPAVADATTGALSVRTAGTLRAWERVLGELASGAGGCAAALTAVAAEYRAADAALARSIGARRVEPEGTP